MAAELAHYAQDTGGRLAVDTVGELSVTILSQNLAGSILKSAAAVVSSHVFPVAT
jgi:hypothetical protein